MPQTGSYTSGSTLVEGWALDDHTLAGSSLSFEVGGQSVTLSGFAYGIRRDDVCATHPSPNCPYVGWSGWLDTTAFGDGSHLLQLRVTDGAGNVTTRQRSFVIENVPEGEPPRVWIDVPAHDQVISGVIDVSGWALATSDLDESSFTLRVDGAPVLLGNFTYGTHRAGVCATYPELESPDCPYVGWTGVGDSTLLSNGTHTLECSVVDADGNMTTFVRHFITDN